MEHKKILLFGLVTLMGTSAIAQRNKLVDQRDQAEGWYLPVHGQVLVDGRKASNYTVELFKENERLGEVAVNKKGSYQLELDIDHRYTIRIAKEGYEDKLILIDTALPPDLVTYPDYECYANLIPDAGQKGMDPFYTDFPSAIVRYNEEMGGFYHSENYLDHIRSKVSGVAQASF
ncbi:MAG: hypothetical protein KDB88_13170 [Flavobacteriales bacterium]|nr:hypothetical protein [Flavobacteriales bacterium]